MLIVGLGNPGPEYKNTRHNIGFLVIDELITRRNAQKLSSSNFEGLLYKFQNTSISLENHFLLKPLTFMNLSGNSIVAVKKFYKIEEVVVIHDDLDLPFGALRFKKGGGHGGHNGLRSIDSNITKEYLRVRIGVGKPEHKSQVSDYVLHDFSEDEAKILDQLVDHVAKACKVMSSEELNEVKSKYSLKSIDALES